MKIFTYQSPIVWDEVKKNKIYTPENLSDKCSFLIDCKKDEYGFIQAYSWLKEQMINRGVSFVNERKDMIWGWNDTNSENAHSLRLKVNREIYDNHYLFELDIPENRLLGSLFYDWHSVLNNCPLIEDPDDDEYWKFLKNNQDLMHKSWENIFNFNFASKFCEKDYIRVIQYTFFNFLFDEVISVKKIENKKSSLVYRK